MNSNIKAILKSFGPLVIVLLLFFFVGKYSLSKISEVRTKIDIERKNINLLTQRLDTLSQIEGEVLSTSSISLSALPSFNPSLIVISQLKKLASENGVTISNVKSGGEAKDKSGLKRVDISFEISGQRALVMQYLQKIKSFAPISLVDKVKLNEVGGVARANTTVKSFWSELPTKLPAFDVAIKDLTVDENRILTDVSVLTQPLFLEIPPSDAVGRPDPFSQ